MSVCADRNPISLGQWRLLITHRRKINKKNKKKRGTGRRRRRKVTKYFFDRQSNKAQYILAKFFPFFFFSSFSFLREKIYEAAQNPPKKNSFSVLHGSRIE
jgi:hypothetical protein